MLFASLRNNARRQTGFTLLELLVAITVFATMSVMAYGGLRNVIDNSEASEQALNRLKDVQTGVSAISRDLTQITHRDIRDEYGNVRSYLLTPQNPDLIIEFSRNGHRNPAGLLRSNLQRVAYQLQDNKLYRLHWPQMDRAPGVEPYKSEILDKVNTVDFRFLDDKLNWHNQWPPLNAGAGQATPVLSAIEISIELADWGEIKRLYEVSL